jgi:hypothetical protein
MKKYTDKLVEFNETFGIAYAQKPTFVLEETGKLRHKLMAEENDEYLEAVEVNDLDLIADALGDQLYILAGTIIAHGLQDKIKKIFKEIHKSNMSKACSNEEEAMSSVLAYVNGEHPDKPGIPIEAAMERVGSKFIVRRLHDNKVLKSINYKPFQAKL